MSDLRNRLRTRNIFSIALILSLITSFTVVPAYPVNLFSADDVVQIDVGGSSACALEEDSDIWCWGYLVNQEFSDTPVKINYPIDNAMQIGVGSGFICALNELGELWCLSENSYLPLNNEFSKMSELPPIKAISTEEDFLCALSYDSEVWCMGSNFNYKFSADRNDGRYTPYKLDFGSEVLSVVTRTWGVCALLVSKQVSCLGLMEGVYWANFKWGTTEEDSDCSNVDYLCIWAEGVFRLKPLLVSGLEDVEQLISGSLTTCALTFSKEIYCWGDLGVHGTELGSAVPDATIRKITLPSEPKRILDSGGRWVAAITCAELVSSEVYCWGRKIEYIADGQTSSWKAPYRVRSLEGLTDLVFSSGMGMCAIFNFGIRCMGGYIKGTSESSIEYNTFGFVEGTLTAPAPPLDLKTTTSSASSITVSWSEPPAFGFESNRAGYEIQWSQDERSWQSARVGFSAHSYEIANLSKGSGYYVRIRTIDSEELGSFDSPITAFTTGTYAQKVKIHDENGDPLIGGSVTWKSKDERFSGAKAFGLNSTGELTFTTAMAGETFVSLQDVKMANGVEVIGDFEATFGFGEVIIEVPLDTWPNQWTVRTSLPNGKTAAGIRIESNLISEHTVNNIKYTVDPYTHTGYTNSKGEFRLIGFRDSPSATATLNDGELLQTEQITLTENLNEVVFQEMPWVTPVKPIIDASSGNLVEVVLTASDSVPLNAKLALGFVGFSNVGKSVKVIPPPGSVQKCKGKKLTGKISRQGSTTLKVCATKSGTYQIQASGLVVTSFVDLRVKGVPPTPVKNISGTSPEAGKALIAWKTPSYSGGAKVIKYIVSLNGKKSLTKEVKTKSVLFSNLKNASTYTVSIWAVTKFGKSDPAAITIDIA